MLPSSTHICFNSYFNSIILFSFFWLKENLEVFRCLFYFWASVFLICQLNMKWWIIKEEVNLLHTKTPLKKPFTKFIWIHLYKPHKPTISSSKPIKTLSLLFAYFSGSPPHMHIRIIWVTAGPNPQTLIQWQGRAKTFFIK